ncbi:MAG TPA: sulfite exporter TauE/SafE family protein [Polyangia bacterium]
MHIDVSGVMVSLPALVAVGLAIGFVAGMFGVGGGFILTPLLSLSFKIPMPIAVGSALCQKIGTSIGSFLKHRQYQHGELRVDFVMVGASIFGVDAGTRLLTVLASLGNFMNARGRPVSIVTLTLEGIYAAMLLFAASMTLNAARKAARAPASEGHASTTAPLVRYGLPPYISLPEVGIPRVSVTVMAYIGFATGLLSGLLGIGGGVALLPVLVYGYGFSIKDAAGTGILLLFATVLVGTVEHALRGNVDLRVALAILAGSSIGSQLGARTTARVSNQILRLSFAVLLLVTVGAIGIDVVRSLTST